MEVTVTQAPVLRAENLYRFYRAGDDETLAVQGITLHLEAGELVALSGPSGSGKSTLLSCLAGTDEPSGGTVWIDGHRMSGRTEGERAALRARYVGTMAQRGDLLAHLTVLGNIRLAQALVPRRQRTGLDPMTLLSALDISRRAHAWPDKLSGGERVRASLAVALANRPHVLLADEPTGELDELTEQRLIGLLQDHAQAGCAVLVASHSPTVAATADRLLQIHDGRLL